MSRPPPDLLEEPHSLGVHLRLLLRLRVLEEELGVSVNWVEGKAGNTRENASFSSAILREKGIQRVLLVTHAWHMPRAKGAFEVAGLEVIPAPTAFKEPAPRELGSYIPSAHNLRESYWGVHEWVGGIWYRWTE